MSDRELHVVTGAFGYSGKVIAQRLLDRGHRVRTLTNSPERDNPFADAIEVQPLAFDDQHGLVKSLRGAAVLYNTYWVRFNHRNFTHAQAVSNTEQLFEAARIAGVGRVVHVSITNPSEDSKLSYFAGKARLERALIESGLPHTILRPAVLFGGRDILINNIAWMLRRFPVFGVFGRGEYRVQPIHVDDFAALAVREGAEQSENRVIDAIGPQTFTYREMVTEVASAIGKRRLILPMPPIIGFIGGWLMGKLLGDVLITWDEVKGLMADLLYTDSLPAGGTRLTDWAAEHRDTLGTRYANELRRRSDRRTAYEKA